MKFIPLIYGSEAANCPLCGAYSNMKWFDCSFEPKDGGGYRRVNEIEFAVCNHCKFYTIWVAEESNSGFYKMVYPNIGSVQQPNDDLPESIKIDYFEAASIVNLSPRGAVALLRLSLQKLCKHLGEPGKDINTDIGSLVKRGLNPSIQMALDSVRVIGNNAVHPGAIDLSDDRETAYKIFGLINFITNAMITQPREINELYNTTVTGGVKEAIDRRDKK